MYVYYVYIYIYVSYIIYHISYIICHISYITYPYLVGSSITPSFPLFVDQRSTSGRVEYVFATDQQALDAMRTVSRSAKRGWKWATLPRQKPNTDAKQPGWCFGCHQFYFPRNIGLHSSSQLTNSYFSEGWPNHQPAAVFLDFECMCWKILDVYPNMKPNIWFPEMSRNHELWRNR